MSVGERPTDVVKPSRLNEQSKKAIDDVFKLIASKSQQGTEKLAKSENLKLEEEDYKEVGEAWQSATKKATKQIIKAIEDNPKTSENLNKLVGNSDNPDIQKATLLENPVLHKLIKATLKKAISQEPAFQSPLLKELLNNQEPKQHGKFTQKVLEERKNPTGLKR